MGVHVTVYCMLYMYGYHAIATALYSALYAATTATTTATTATAAATSKVWLHYTRVLSLKWEISWVVY